MRKPTQKRDRVMGLRLPLETYERLARAAERHGRTRHGHARWIIQTALAGEAQS